MHAYKCVYCFQHYSGSSKIRYFGDDINSGDLFFIERFPFWEVQMQYIILIVLTQSKGCVLCREVYYSVSLFGRVHYRGFQGILNSLSLE